MSKPQSTMSCAQKGWLGGAVLGIMLFLVLLIWGSWSFLTALIAGIVVCVGAGVPLSRVICQAEEDATPGAMARPNTDTARPEPERQAAPDPEPATPSVTQAEAGDSTPSPEAPVSEVRGGPRVQPSRPLPGQAELAARRGTWTYRPG